MDVGHFKRLKSRLGEVGIEFAHFFRLRDEIFIRRLRKIRWIRIIVSSDLAPSSFSTKVRRSSIDFFEYSFIDDNGLKNCSTGISCRCRVELGFTGFGMDRNFSHVISFSHVRFDFADFSATSDIICLSEVSFDGFNVSIAFSDPILFSHVSAGELVFSHCTSFWPRHVL